uniref:NADH-ubiquinone oxidoreductase chain 4 n=1 Tax=Corythucha ciliata TaxID=369451 RepID=V5JF98_CORCT|nr:NADH dehydrogenase subunit 4 [Corythucha ciliata]AGM48384.1 NADH dehydrogenase subunit 4 [Corythucha ciliata]
MMILIFTIFSLIPIILSNSYFLMLISLMLTFLMLIFLSPMNYLSSLSYIWGLDPISWGFILLLIMIIYLMIYSSYSYNLSNKSKEFILMIFFLLLFLFFCFLSTSLFMYYIFFEASLIPTLFLIFGWGYQPERLMAGFYLIFYTLFASLPLLLSIFYLINVQGLSFFWLINLDLNFYLFLCLTMAFLVKMPMFMLHLWLPSAHVEAPISGSMILAGLLLKLGGYGLMRVSLFLYEYMCLYSLYINSLSLFGGLVCGLICCVQLDMKVLVAYSSVCHMSLCIMGIFTLGYWGFVGSYILMLAHGLCSSALFCLVNIVYDRSGSRSLLINKGFMIFMPSLCLFWFILCSNNMGSPLSMNLFGELMLILGLLGWTTSSSFFLMSMSFLACVYSMYLFSFVNHGFVSMYNFYIYNCSIREYMLIFFHLVPLNLVGLKFNMFLCMF